MIAALGLALMLQGEGESFWQERFRRLEAKVEKLQKQNDDLRTMNEALKLNQRALQTELTKLAEHMLRVRSMSGGTVAPASASPNLSKSAQPNPGPSRTVKAKVRFVNTDFNFVILNVGEAQGVEPGFQFDVWREGSKIAVLEVEAFADEERKMTKARVKEGDIKALIVGDEGVARRVGTPNIVSPDNIRHQLSVIEQSKARVTGRMKENYMVTVGKADGLTVGDKVFVYRNGKLRGALKLEFVDKDWSLGKRDDSLHNEEIFEGDVVTVKRLGPVLAGNIRSIPTTQGLFIDLGLQDGAQPGQTYRVSRLGKEIGKIRLKTVNDHWSVGKAVEPSRTEDFEKGDFVELTP